MGVSQDLTWYLIMSIILYVMGLAQHNKKLHGYFAFVGEQYNDQLPSTCMFAQPTACLPPAAACHQVTIPPKATIDAHYAEQEAVHCDLMLSVTVGVNLPVADMCLLIPRV